MLTGGTITNHAVSRAPLKLPLELYIKTGRATGRLRARSSRCGPQARPDSRRKAENGVISGGERMYGDFRAFLRPDGERGVPEKLIKINRI